MRRIPLGERSAIWLAGIVAVSIGLVATVSPGAAVVVLVAATLVFRVAWWMPWALAVGLLALSPYFIARGETRIGNLVATLVVVLLAIAVALLIVEQRRKLRD